MPKKTKVLPITMPKPTNPEERYLIAHDAITRRYIFAIGPRRFAFDWTSRVTKLPPGTDRPAPVVPFPNQKKLAGQRNKRIPLASSPDC
jgi:hypothetical protein